MKKKTLIILAILAAVAYGIYCIFIKKDIIDELLDDDDDDLDDYVDPELD